MGRVGIVAALLASLALLLAPAVAANQGPNKPPPAQVVNPAAMSEQRAASLVRVSEKYLDFLAQKSTTDKLATFQKNYFDALVLKGFNREEAFQLVRDMGNPLEVLNRPQRD